MKPVKSNASKTIALFSLFLLITLSIFSCGSDDKKKDDPKDPEEKAASKFKMNCVILTRAQIQKWVDSGWTAPGPNKINKLVYQFYSADPSGLKDNMQLVCYPGKSLTNVYGDGESIMGIDTQCTAKEFTGPVILANNSQNFDNLKITKADGTLEAFDFIRLIPEQKYPPYITFKTEVVREAKAILSADTWPCPKICQE